ncbi:MAG: hypothetical protein IPK12_10485 [Gemmatimonadetes bacterium]|nr:hypothetical protein [Gemmatimonadota bacterium]
MTQPLGMEDFFSLEATEYLDKLAGLVAGPVAPSADEVVRFTRALRGSALMANQAPIARAASGLEHLLRGYRDGRRPWDQELGALTREAVTTLKDLVQRVRGWGLEETARAERLAAQLESAAGGARAITAPMPALNEVGIRAFLAREAAAVGSVLDQASRTLTSSPTSDVAQVILRRMQPLRGLAALNDYPPLPDVLDGVERTVGELARLELRPERAVARLETAATALARAARDIAERGRPDADASEFRHFAELLLAPDEGEAPIVPIESLYYAGEDGLVERRSAHHRAMGAGMAAATVVSRGEHLSQSADELAHAGSAAQRDIRLHTLVSDLRTMAVDLPAGLDRAVEAFASAARAAVGRGAAAAEATTFVKLLLEGADLLKGFTDETEPVALAARFDPVIAALDMLGAPVLAPPEPVETRPAPQPEPLPERLPADVVPIESLAPSAPEDDESDVVPIESLFYDEPELAEPLPVPVVAPSLPSPRVTPPPMPAITVVPPAAAAPAPPVPEPTPVAAAWPATAETEGWDLAASFTLYEALVAGGRAAAAPAAPMAAVAVAAPEAAARPQRLPPRRRPNRRWWTLPRSSTAAAPP